MRGLLCALVLHLGEELETRVLPDLCPSLSPSIQLVVSANRLPLLLSSRGRSRATVGPRVGMARFRSPLYRSQAPVQSVQGEIGPAV